MSTNGNGSGKRNCPCCLSEKTFGLDPSRAGMSVIFWTCTGCGFTLHETNVNDATAENLEAHALEYIQKLDEEMDELNRQYRAKERMRTLIVRARMAAKKPTGLEANPGEHRDSDTL